MKAALVVAPETQLVARPEYTREMLDLIKNTYAKGANDNEFALFIHTAKHLELDPLAGQICLIPNWDKDLQAYVKKPCVKIDGFRAVAEGTGKYKGQTPPEWCGADGVWKDVWNGEGYPFAARCGVRRTGFDEPTYAVAKWETYARKTKKGEFVDAWARMPDLMLHKCAEALALRKTFPKKLGGVYAPEEMEQAGGGGVLRDAVEHGTIGVVEATRMAQQEREKKESDALTEDWMAMIDAWQSENDAMQWCYFNGFACQNLHANAKSRVWRRIKKKAEELKIDLRQIREELQGAPEFPSDRDEGIDPDTGEIRGEK